LEKASIVRTTNWELEIGAIFVVRTIDRALQDFWFEKMLQKFPSAKNSALLFYHLVKPTVIL
jgi:hypothetical protein